MDRMRMMLIATALLCLIATAAVAGPWAKLDNPIRTSDGRSFHYEFYDNTAATGGGIAVTNAIKGYVTSVSYG